MTTALKHNLKSTLKIAAAVFVTASIVCHAMEPQTLDGFIVISNPQEPLFPNDIVKQAMLNMDQRGVVKLWKYVTSSKNYNQNEKAVNLKQLRDFWQKKEGCLSEITTSSGLTIEEAFNGPFSKLFVDKDIENNKIQHLVSGSTLTTLIWGFDGQLSDDGVRALSEGLKENKTITELNLCRNGLGKHLKILLEGLTTNKTIIQINLDHNNIWQDSAKVIAEFLQNNTTLVTLSLHKNYLFDSGIEALTEGLKTNKTLKNLVVSENCTTKDWTKAIGEAFPNLSVTEGSLW